MCVIAVQVRVNPQKQEEFLQAIRSLQDENGGKEGQSLTLTKDDERATYNLVNEWNTEEQLAEQLAGDEFKILLGALQVLCEETVVHYEHVPENLIQKLDAMFEQGNTAH